MTLITVASSGFPSALWVLCSCSRESPVALLMECWFDSVDSADRALCDGGDKGGVGGLAECDPTPCPAGVLAFDPLIVVLVPTDDVPAQIVQDIVAMVGCHGQYGVAFLPPRQNNGDAQSRFGE